MFLGEVFWVAVVLIAYTYVGYPVAIALVGRILPRPVRRNVDFLPKVSVVIAAYDEEKHIERKLRDLFNQDYPQDKLEILIGSDGSTDATNTIVRSFSPRATLYALESRGGKPRVLNAVVPQAQGEIVVFSDVRQTFSPQAIRELVANFADASVGSVSGELIFRDVATSQIGVGLGLYWNYEVRMRTAESHAYSMLGATGAIYAIRRVLFRPLPEDTILDDMLTPLSIVSQGYRAIFEPRAKAYDSIAQTPGAESRRKVRTLAGNMQLFMRILPLMSLYFLRILVQLISHKVMRLVVPFLLILLFISNALIASTGFWYGVLFILQMLFYLLAYAGSVVEGKKPLVLTIPYVFCQMNYDAVRGILACLSSRHSVLWSKG